MADILEQIVRPGRDPRADLPAPVLRSDVLSMDDLLPGLALKGTVRNVVDFGAFVDIGVKQDGLLHRSQLPFGTVLGVGDVIDVEIQSVEAERGRISLGWVGDSGVGGSQGTPAGALRHVVRQEQDLDLSERCRSASLRGRPWRPNQAPWRDGSRPG